MKMYMNMKELELELVLESIRNKANITKYIFLHLILSIDDKKYNYTLYVSTKALQRYIDILMD